MRFAVVIHKDEGSSYGVIVPDLPGCFSGGDTLDEAFANAEEAVLCHVEGLFMDGELLPETRPIQEHQANDRYTDALCWGYVDVDLASVSRKSVRLNITLPAHIAKLVDEAAANAKESRSGFLARAALERITGVGA